MNASPQGGSGASRTCGQCAGSFARRQREKPNHFKKRRYCSLKCRAEAKRRPTQIYTALEWVCPQCKGPVTSKERAGLARRKFCSPRCAYAWQRANAAPRLSKREKPKVCVICRREFWARGKSVRAARQYCSYKCFRVVSSKRPQMMEATCVACGKTFRRTHGALKRVKLTFCSMGCSQGYQVGERNTSYRGGSDPNRGQAWIKLAEKIRVRDGHRCGRCGKTQEENGQKLSVDHIMPWRRFEDKAAANDPSNLVSLCRACHSHKTGRAERKMLRGDMTEFETYRRAIALPFAAETTTDRAEASA